MNTFLVIFSLLFSYTSFAGPIQDDYNKQIVQARLCKGKGAISAFSAGKNFERNFTVKTSSAFDIFKAAAQVRSGEIISAPEPTEADLQMKISCKLVRRPRGVIEVVEEVKCLKPVTTYFRKSGLPCSIDLCQPSMSIANEQQPGGDSRSYSLGDNSMRYTYSCRDKNRTITDLAFFDLFMNDDELTMVFDPATPRAVKRTQQVKPGSSLSAAKRSVQSVESTDVVKVVFKAME